MKKQGVLTAEGLSVFCYQLALMMRAGIGAEESVELLAEGLDATPLLAALLEELKGGASLSQSLAACHEFPDYMVRMVEIGQASGRLDQVLDALSLYYRREAETTAAVRHALLYPAVMAVLVSAVFLVLMLQVLPVFQKVFLQMGVSLSPVARGLLQLGSAGKYLGGGLVLLLGIVALVLLLLSRRGTQSIEAGFLARGASGRAVERSRFASAMALMLNSGLPLDEAMERTVHLLEGATLAPSLVRCQQAMEQGTDFAKAVAACGLLDRAQAGLLAAGFRAGLPGRAMEELASRCQSEAEDRLSRLLGRLELILVVVLCAAVGLVLLSVMLPLLGVLSAIG